MFGDFVNAESLAVRNNDETGFGTIIARQLVKLMGGDLTAVSPSGLSGNLGLKVTFTITTYSNERPIKKLNLSNIKKFEQIRALVIMGIQNRDEELLGAIHLLGLESSVTAYQKSTVNQIKTNLSNPEGKYHMIIIDDDDDFDGFEAARSIWENKLHSSFIIIMVSSNDKKGNYLKCITMGIDHYLVKPFDGNELCKTIQSSFSYVENTASSVDIDKLKRDLQILVVEDNKMNQDVIIKMLKSLGYSCEISKNGYDGYLKAKNKKFDLILMDLILPEMDGFESARKILESDKSYIIVALTADNMPDSKRKAELSGIRDFIAKPVKIDDLKKLFAKYFH